MRSSFDELNIRRRLNELNGVPFSRIRLNDAQVAAESWQTS